MSQTKVSVLADAVLFNKTRRGHALMVDRMPSIRQTTMRSRLDRKV